MIPKELISSFIKKRTNELITQDIERAMKLTKTIP